MEEDAAYLDASFRVSKDDDKNRQQSETFIQKNLPERAKLLFAEPEYDSVRPQIAETLRNETVGVAELMVDKFRHNELFRADEIEDISRGLDSKMADFVAQQHKDQIHNDPNQSSSVTRKKENRLVSYLKKVAAGIAQKEAHEGNRVQIQEETNTPGSNLAEVLDDYNTVFLTTLTRQGMEAGQTHDTLVTQLAQKYPEYDKEKLKTIVDGVQESRSAKDKISDLQLYFKIINTLGSGRKAKIAGIAALSAVSSVGRLFAAQGIAEGVAKQNEAEWLAGTLGIGVIWGVETMKSKMVQDVMTDFMEGKDVSESATGLRNDMIRVALGVAPELSHINAASLILNNPNDLQSQINRIQYVAQSLPTRTLPGLIDFMSASIYLAARDPHLATMLPGIVTGAWMARTSYQASESRKPLEVESRQIQAEQTQVLQDLQSSTPYATVRIDRERLLDLITRTRNLARERIKTETKYQLQRLEPFSLLNLYGYVVNKIGAHVDLSQIMSLANAQVSEAQAISNLASSYFDVRSLLAPLHDLHAEIGAAQEREKTFVPDNHNISLRGVRLLGKDKIPYLTVDNVQIQQGEKIWLDGESGKGKSQFIQLLYGKKADEGLVTIGNHTQGETRIRALRMQTALKPQEVQTVNASLGANIGGADFDEETVAEVVSESGLAESLFSDSLPIRAEERIVFIKTQLKDTKVASSFYKNGDGRQLSDGQKQLLGLARIEYQLKNSEREIAEFERKIQEEPIEWKKKELMTQIPPRRVHSIILDEPTNHLDQIGKEYAKKLIDKWISDPTRTVIITSHDEGLRQKFEEDRLRKIIVANGKVQG